MSTKRDHETGEVIRDSVEELAQLRGELTHMRQNSAMANAEAREMKARLDLLRETADEVCNELTAVSHLRVGAMDTNARADEINRQLSGALTSSVLKLRSALGA